MPLERAPGEEGQADWSDAFLAEVEVLGPPASIAELNSMTLYQPSVLVIDDVGLTPFSQAEANAFCQVVNRRYEASRSTIVTTNRGLACGLRSKRGSFASRGAELRSPTRAASLS